jgi:hypothetical protein
MLMGKGMFLNSLSTFNRQKKFYLKDAKKKKSDHAVFQ